MMSLWKYLQRVDVLHHLHSLHPLLFIDWCSKSRCCNSVQFLQASKNSKMMGSDGASVIMGCNSSFQTRLEIVNRKIFVMKCICHSAHLAASFACTRLPCQTEEFIRDVYSYFNHSARHLAVLAEFQYFTGTEPHKLLHLCQTRRPCLQLCVSRIYLSSGRLFQSTLLMLHR